MKSLTILSGIMLTVHLLAAQANIISTSFYSLALDETKEVNVFLPPGYDENPDLYYPVIYFLHGWQGDQNSGDGVMNTANSMINQGLIEPVIMVCAHNSPPPFGGSVYTNSILWGDYETYMVEDLCNWIEATYRAMPGKHYRAVFGMSMGGYGAFRYGILHNDKYCALAACAGPVSFLEDYMCTQFRQMILQASQGPPYFYNYATGGPYTQIYFLYYGAFTPNYNTPQTYINPAILEFPLDENGNYIDTILAKVIPHDIANLVNQLTPDNSPGIYFGCGTNDPFFLYPGNMDVKDSLDLYGIPYTFYSHGGGHTMPAEFTENALIFLDSLLLPPVIPCSCLPEGIAFNTQEQIENFQVNYLGCREIEGDATILGGGITKLNGLSVLTSIGGDLTIGSSGTGQGTMLSSLKGLENLEFVGGALTVVANYSLTSLSRLNNLSSVGDSVNIQNNEPLTSLTGLDNITELNGSITIARNHKLNSLNGLQNIQSIGGSLFLGVIDFWGSNQYIVGNNSLTDLSGLDALNSVGGDLFIGGHDSLTSLAGLQNLNDIGGNLQISLNKSLNNLTGLEGLTSVEGNVKIGGTFFNGSGNSSLIDLTGLENLTSIDGNLLILDNSTLTNLTGIDNIAAGSIIDLSISNNDSLSTCEVTSICEYLADTNGTVTIHNNAPGCNSQEEVEEACLVGVGQLDGWTVGQLPVIVYPNPFSEIVHFEFEIPNPSPVRIQIFNVVGNMVADLSDGILAEGKHQITWNVADLPAGMYFIRLNAGKKSAGLKLIKQ